MPASLPKSLDDVTSDWVQGCLQERWPGLRLEGLHVAKVIHGAATKIKLRLEVASSSVRPATPVPPSLWLKIGFEPHHGMMEPIYGAETTFFGTIRKFYDVHTPDCFFAALQPEPFQFALLLEDLDLRDVEFNSAIKPLTPDQVAAGLEALAALHGQSWNDRRIAEAGVARPFDNLSKMLDAYYRPNLAGFFRGLRACAVPFSLRDEARFLEGMDRYVPLVRQGEFLLHGDAHVGNTYKENGAIGFLDWQCIAIGNPIHDVAYFMIAALDISDRRASEQDLLQHYLKARAGYPAAPKIEFGDFWQEYRQAAFMSFFTWMTNSDEWQPPEINMSACARAGAAMIDLDCYGALRI
jgi:hypothetical protein